MSKSTLVEIGGVARAHGIRGEIVVHTHDPASAVLADVDQLHVGGVTYAVDGARDTDKGWLVQLAGVTTRNDAEALQGKVVEVERDALALSPDDVLLCDLVGCDVRLPDGRAWGKIVAIDAGPQDRLVIHDGNVERLLPLVDAFVVGVDVDANVVTVDPPEGLPEDPIPR